MISYLSTYWSAGLGLVSSVEDYRFQYQHPGDTQNDSDHNDRLNRHLEMQGEH